MRTFFLSVYVGLIAGAIFNYFVVGDSIEKTLAIFGIGCFLVSLIWGVSFLFRDKAND